MHIRRQMTTAAGPAPEDEVSVNAIASDVGGMAPLAMFDHTRRIGFLILACGTMYSSPARSQSIRGTLVDSATGAPLTAFAAVLLDMRGGVVAQSWSREDGRFFLQAPGQGDYTLRMQRLGYRKRLTSVSVGAAQVVEVRVAMSRIAASLSSVRVTANARCDQIAGDGSGDVGSVWEAARNAFELIALSATRRDLMVKVLDQTADSTSRQRDSMSTTTERTGHSIDPYPSLSPAAISHDGYVASGNGVVHYYAPGASILMSDEFLRDHCFRLERSSSEGDRIGIAFEPTPDRHVTDVAGVVWMKRPSSEPISVDYNYTALPAAARGGRAFGGHAEFVSIPDGGWLLREWSVRAPLFDVVQRTRYSSNGGMGLSGGVSATRFADSLLAGAHEEGGRILLVRSSEGKVLWADSLGVIAGRVVDSATHEPIRDVSITLRGSPRSARTDPSGRFLVDSVVPGTYPLVAELRRFGLAPLSTSTFVPVLEAANTAHVLTTVMLPLSRATRDALEALRDGVTQQCTELRQRRESELDAEFQIAPNEWSPRGVDSAAVSNAVRRSAVVLEAIVDTTGRTDPNSIRILRNGPTLVMRQARDAILSAQSTVEQPQPGCKVRHLLVLPYLLGVDRP